MRLAIHRIHPARLLAFICLLTSIAASAQAIPKTAPTPPMGWNSWNYFASKVDDAGVRAAADMLIATGMRDAGYVYVNIDDTWEGQRDASGVLHANSKFPDMKALADYVHSRGLKLGIYSSPGPKTCAGYEGSYNHEEQDAELYSSWGIDYLKYDLCGYRDIMDKEAPNDPVQQMKMMRDSYAKMSRALKKATENTGRPIVYSLCQYGWDAVWEWAPTPEIDGNLWRSTGDISANFDRIYTIGEQQAGLAQYAGPGHWNDPDMLEVGNGNLSLAENRTHFSWWAMLSAPLIAGNDLPHMKPEIRDLLTNKDVIAIDQDTLGHQAIRAYSDGEVEVWTKPLAGGALAIMLINGESERYISHPFHLNLQKLGLAGPQRGKDLWTGQPIRLTDDQPIEIPSHDVLLVRLAHPTKAP